MIVGTMQGRGNAMRLVLLILLSVLAPSLCAQTIYKCRDHKSQAVYQSFPCGGTKPPEKVWSGSYRQPTNAELWQRYNRDLEWRKRQERDRRRRPFVYSGGGTSPQGMKALSNRAACSYARKNYERVQADFTLNRNIDLLRRLEADIRRYCEVRP
jgi:hypothetical protein